MRRWFADSACRSTDKLLSGNHPYRTTLTIGVRIRVSHRGFHVDGSRIVCTPNAARKVTQLPTFLITSMISALRATCETRSEKEGASVLLRAIIAVLLILWLLGFVLRIARSVIHLLALIAIVVLIYDLVTRSRAKG